MENIAHQTVSILAGLVLLVSSSVAALPAKIHDFTNKFSYNPTSKTLTNKPQTKSGNKASVLAANVDKNTTGVTFTIPAFFKDTVKMDKTLEIIGELTAPNVIYGLKAGTNITITGGQNPTINAQPSGVTSLGGSTGSLSLAAGGGISVSGLTITNSDKGTTQNIFKTFSVSGQDDIVADSNTDALTFVAGAGIVLTNSASNDSVTITSNLDPGWTDDGTAVRLSTATDSVGIGTTAPAGSKLSVGTSAQFRIDESGNLTRINDVAYSFPGSQGAASTVLVNDGAGSLSWGALSAGSLSADSLDFSEFKDALTLDANLSISATASNYSIDIDGGTLFVDTANNRIGIGSSSPSTTLYVAGTGTVTGAFSAGATTLASLNNSSGGITNAGAITGATGLTSTGTITFGSLGLGIAHLSGAGVLTSSAVNIASSDITGTLATTSGGTGLTTYATGDMLYGSATNVLGKLGIGGSGQVLSVSNGLPVWSTILGGSGGLCPNCLISDPGSTQTIAPTGSATTGLAIRQTSTGGGTPDIFKVTSSDGATSYLRVDSTGNVVLGTGSSTGVFTVNPASTDPIAISPVAQGAGAFTGTITSADLTAARTWTLPNATGSFCLDTGNCAGSGSNLGGSGTANYLARWNAQYVLENGTIFDNGNIGIGTTNPLAKLEVADTAWLRGSTSTNGLYVASNGNVGIGTTSAAYALDVAGTENVSGAVTLGSTLNVTGASTLSSTLDVTGRTTIGGNLQVNGTGSSWIMGNLGLGTSSPTSTLTFGSAATVGLATSTTALNVQSGLLNLDTTNSRVGVGTTAPQATFDVTNNAISTGTGLLVSSTSTSFSSGLLASIDWSPGSSTTATGDILSINVGANGIVGNIFNVKDNGTSVFSVSQTAITAGLPVNFTAPGDVNVAYDLLFTNQTAGNIKSLGPLAIEAGEAFESNYLTLRTFNAGQLVLDLSGGLTLNQAQNWTLATATNALNISNVLGIDSTNSRMGVGTTAPKNRLDVNGSAAFGSLPTSPLPQSNSAYFSGNVGLGTSNPTGKLQIVSGDMILGTGTFNNTSANEDAYVTGNLEVDGTIYGAVSGTVNPNVGLGSVLYQGASGITATPASFYWDSTNNRLGIGHSAPLASLDVVGASWLRGSATTTGLFVDTAGKIGIGTTGPTNQLDVSGSVAFGSLPTTALPQSNSAYFSGNVGIGTTNPGANLDIGSSATTGIGERITANSLTTGQGLSITSTSTALSTGSLAAIDWSPGASTTATGDMLSINVGANGIVGNIFNVKDNGTSVFSVSQTAITAGLPVNFTAPGDVGVAYDLNFTNQTASYIKSNAPLTIEVGESWESNDFTIRTFNAGQLVLDTPSGLTLNQAQQWTFASSAQALNISNGLMNFDTTNARVGIGNSNPQNKLDVKGAVAFGTTLPSGPLPQADSAYFSGNVGLGTSNPGGKLAFATATTAAGGIDFGGDTNLYRSAANTLKTDDGFTIAGGALTLSLQEIFLSTSYCLKGNNACLTYQAANGLNTFAGSGTGLQFIKSDLTTEMARFSAAGNLGIGTTGPRNKLDVSGSVAFGSIPDTALPQANSAYFSGRVGIGTTNPSTSLQIVGGDCSDDAGGGGCTADYAELYPSSENVEKGDVLMIDSSAGASAQATVKRANKAYAHNLIGIVSTNPAAIAEGSKMTFMNTEYKLDPRKPAVALAGRVPVKIDPNSEPITAGDALTSSTTPGVAMKATKAGPIIGKALESWTPSTTNNSPSTPEKILVFVNNTWADPALVLNETGEVNGATSTMASVSPERVDGVAKDMAKALVAFDAMSGKLDTLDSKVSGVESEIEKLMSDNSALKEKVDALVGALHEAPNVGVATSNPDVIPAVELESIQIDSGSEPGMTDALATADSLIDGKIGEFSDLRVSGLAKLNDINVIGNASIGFLDITGMDLAGGSNIDTITGPLRLQATAQNSLEIMNGKVIVSKEGNITTTGEITAKKLNILDDSVIPSEVEGSGSTKSDSSIGTGTLLKNTKKIVISTTALTRASKVFITPKTLLDYPLVVTSVKAGESFTVEVKSAEDKDVDFDWFIVN